MPSQLVTLRLPTGTEYSYRGELPDVGATVSHAGRSYVVTARDEDEGHIVLTLEDEEVAPFPGAAVPQPGAETGAA